MSKKGQENSIVQRKHLLSSGKNRPFDPTTAQQPLIHNKTSKILDLYALANTPAVSFYILIGYLLVDFFISCFILKKVPYTEIDWVAYMQEVGGVINGEMNYLKLRGDTGPLVYPAAFVYIYAILYYLTDHGTNIWVAQIIFTGLFCLTQVIIVCIFFKCRTACPSVFMLAILFISKRLHSIYILRCFNDCFAMLFVYLAVLCLLHDSRVQTIQSTSPTAAPSWWWWYLASTCFSIGIGIKMNVMLFLPGYFVLLVYKYPNSFLSFFKHILTIIVGQIVIGMPFLVTFPWQYLQKSFEFGRVFTYIWTVNWKCIPESVFVSPPFAKLMLALQLIFLVAIFARLDMISVLRLWHASFANIFTRLHLPYPSQLAPHQSGQLTIPRHVILSRLFLSNFIGIVCAKSLHYQFYSWYAQQLPLILALVVGAYSPVCNVETAFVCSSKTHPSQPKTAQPQSLITLLIQHGVFFVLWGCIELTWNVFPSNFSSSLLWQVVHWTCLLVIVWRIYVPQLA